MAWRKRWLGASITALSGWVLTGCASLPDYAVPKRSLAADISEPALPRVTRTQMPEGRPVTLEKPVAPQIGPPPGVIGPPPGVIGPPPGLGIEPASLSSRGTVRVSVRAWVNNKPIFDAEVMESAMPGLRDAQRTGKTTELLNSKLEEMIDSELVYQDAVKKLEKNNPKALDKLREFVDQEFDKSIQRLRDAGYPADRLKDLEPVARRMLERNLISMEYVRSRVKPIVETRIGFNEIRDYYELRKNEFRTVDKVVWQDIFIPVSPNLPSVADAKRFAEDKIERCRTAEDFNRLMVYNDGDSKLRNGEGFGQRKGEVRPIELEEHLFSMREGEIGPVVAFSTGVHLFRVTKREYAAQLPLNDETQNKIRRILENQLADREFKRMVRELRQRAIVRIEKEDMP